MNTDIIESAKVTIQITGDGDVRAITEDNTGSKLLAHYAASLHNQYKEEAKLQYKKGYNDCREAITEHLLSPINSAL